MSNLGDETVATAAEQTALLSVVHHWLLPHQFRLSPLQQARCSPLMVHALAPNHRQLEQTQTNERYVNSLGMLQSTTLKSGTPHLSLASSSCLHCRLDSLPSPYSISYPALRSSYSPNHFTSPTTASSPKPAVLSRSLASSTEST